MAEPQTKFVLTEEARCYLRWLAKEVLLVKTEHEAAKHLLLQRIEMMRRENKGAEPSLAELKQLFSDQKASEEDS